MYSIRFATIIAKPPRGGFWLALACFGVAAASGCASRATVPASVAQGQPVERALITYRVADGDAPPGAQPPGTVRTLTIRYPHPAGHPNVALVELATHCPMPDSAPKAVDPRPAWRKWLDQTGDSMRGGPELQLYEAWRMDIPRGDIDHIVSTFARDGFFDAAPAQSGPVEVAAHVDGVWVSKAWQRVGTLEDLAAAVERQGHLASRGPAAPQISPAGRAAWELNLPEGVTSSEEAAQVRPSANTLVNRQRGAGQHPAAIGATGAPGTAMQYGAGPTTMLRR